MARKKVGKGEARGKASMRVPAPEPPAQWTVMVYMAAVQDDLETEPAAIRDLRELERFGSTEAVKVVVQLDRRWPGIPERYVVRKKTSEPASEPERKSKRGTDQRTDQIGHRTSSGDLKSLTSFLKWSCETYHPARQYLLVLWGHSFGLGFGRDHGDALTLQELHKALKIFVQNARQELGDKNLDLLGANACAMSYVEAAYELRGAAEYLVAPETTMPFAGWPYATILDRLTPNRPGRRGSWRMHRQRVPAVLPGAERCPLAAAVCEGGRPAQRPLGARANAAGGAVESEDEEPVAGAFHDTAHGDVRPLIDLFDLCQNLTNLAELKDTIVDTQAQRVRDLLKQNSGELIHLHKKDPDFEGLNGLGIYAPAVTSGADLKRLELDPAEYRKLALSQDTDSIWRLISSIRT